MEYISGLAIEADLTEQEKKHVQLMADVVRSLSDTPMTLKGGTALLLAYGLDRHSEDLDFDSNKSIRLESRLHKVVSPGIEIKKVDCLKDSQTMLRYRVNYRSEHGAQSLKIETSFRSYSEDSHIVHGMKVYKTHSLLEQKLSAIENRTAARDLYDIHFLVTQHGNCVTESSQKRLQELLRDLDGLEQRFASNFRLDFLVSRKDISTVLVQLSEAVEKSHLLNKKIDTWLQNKEAVEFADALVAKKEIAEYATLMQRYERRALNEKEENTFMSLTKGWLADEKKAEILQEEAPALFQKMKTSVNQWMEKMKSREKENDRDLSW